MGDLIPLRPSGPDAREGIAATLDELNLICGAALVRAGLPAPDVERPLTLEIATRHGLSGSDRRVLTALIVAWCAGRDADVLRALGAWERAGCEDCAVAVVTRGATACSRCAEVG